MYIVNQDFEVFEENRTCSYFEDRVSDIRYRYLNFCSITQYQKMLERGWRRFGKVNFVPECRNCSACISMRIDVKNYKFSKSDKRVLNKNRDTKLFIRKPSVTHEHLNLYNKYHKTMNDKKSWPYSPISSEDYIKSYVEGNVLYAKEFLFVRDEKLVAVSLVDVLPKAVSAIYTYYDHDYYDLSLGKFSILAQIKLAKELDIPYVYLGYWIKDHYSMGYKKEYKPFEVLKNRATLDEVAIWESVEN